MRTINAGITSAEIGRALAPRHAATIQNELLTFAAPTTQTNANLDTSVPQSYAMRYTGNGAYSTFRWSTGTAYLRYVDVTTAANFELDSTNAYEISTSGTLYAMRSGVYTTGTTHYIVTAYPSGGAIQVRRAALTSTSNPVSVSWSNYNTTFGSALTDTAGLVRRVEAVCGTAGAGVVVAVGEHDYTNSFSTISFYWLPDSSQTPVLLNNFIQMPLTAGYAAWYDRTNYCTHIAAASMSNGDLCIVANASPAGRSVYFTVRNGIESEIKPVIPTDIEQTSVSFLASSITEINGLYYMAGRVIRTDSAGTAQGYDGYLVSDDFEHWSFGERSHYISTSEQAGTLLYPATGASVYYVGNLKHTSASATPLQYSGVSGQSVTITSDVLAWSNSQITDGADTLELSLANPQNTYGSSAIVKRGAVLYLDSGQEATLSDFGVFGVDRIADSVDVNGRASGLKLSSRDIAGKRLADWHAPVDLFFQSQNAIVANLTDDAGLIIKTPEDAGYTFSSGDRLRHDGLNTPFIAYADATASDVTLQKAVVKMPVSDNAHQSSIGFLVGAGDDGGGNLMLLGKTNTWATYGKTQPAMRYMALPSVDSTDPNADNTGFNLTARKNTWWTNAGNGDIRTVASPGGTYRTQSTYSIPVDTLTDVALRTSGRRVQLWAKTHATTAATFADNAAWSLKAEYLFDYQSIMRRPLAKSYAGLTLATDVWGDTTAFVDGAYDDFEQTITYATNSAENASFTQAAVNVSGQSPIGDRLTLECAATPSMLVVGQYIRVILPSWDDQLRQITNISGITVTLNDTLAYATPGATGTIYTLADDATWGFADSGKRNFVATEADELGDLPVNIDPKAKKYPRAIRGRGVFVTDDNTAASIRFIESDGVRHYLRSGDETRTRTGWDETNPISLDDDPFYSGGSDPSVWRLILHHGYVFASSPSTYGMPTTLGYLKVDDEVIRYKPFTFYKRGMINQTTWTIIPAYYAPLASATGPTSTIRNWRSTGGAQPGDNFGTMDADAAGLLVDIVSKNGGQVQGDSQYYVDSFTNVGSPDVDNTSYITLNEAYPNSVRGPDPDVDAPEGAIDTSRKMQLEGDMAVISGRGQFETIKDKHDADAPVVYYPCNSSGTQATIQVSRYEMYSGRYTSVEDSIKRVCTMAGQRAVSFRNAFTSSYVTGEYSFTIGTSATTLPLYEDVSDFVLDLNCHIPGNGLGSGLYNNRLNVTFRDYYRLTFQRYNTATDYTNNRRGNLFIGLSNTTTDVTAPASTDFGQYRWFEHVVVPITDYDFSGTATGSGSNWTHNEDTDKNVDLRIIAQGNTIIVEMNGQPVWTFNLNNYADTTTTTTGSYTVTTAGNITVAYTTAISGNDATARVLELGDELDGVAIRKNSTARSGIDDVIGGRHIRSRTTAAGGIEFGQYYARDDAGNLQYNLMRDDSTLDDALQLGHVQVIGDEVAGEAMDDTTLRTEGYMFDVVSNDLMTSAAQCALEARLVLREKRELQELRSVSGYGRIALQPEDKVALVYAPTGSGVPAHTSTDHVINSLSLTADNKSVKATYSLRKYVSSF
jgi:phage protein D